MKVCGIICEYNPFHNGHKFQIDMLKEKFDAVVVIMSGSFVQRGDVAIVDKWTRAKSALLNGVNLVLEMPVAFSLSPAQIFAFGGVGILNSLKVIDSLSFGSECGDIHILRNAAQTLLYETEEKSLEIKHLMKEGFSHASAVEKVYSNIIPSEILSKSNNILAVEYIKQLLLLKSSIKPITHKRIGNEYNDTTINDVLSSASAIRSNYLNKELIYAQIPENTHKLLDNATPHNIEYLDKVVMYKLLTTNKEQLLNLFDVNEGLENRILSSVTKYKNIKEIVEGVSTKRYTHSKIRRILLTSLLSIDKRDLKILPDYIRVLGSDKVGFDILRQIKENTDLKIITKVADYSGNSNHFIYDIMSTNIYSFAQRDSQIILNDYTSSPVIK